MTTRNAIAIVALGLLAASAPAAAGDGIQIGQKYRQIRGIDEQGRPWDLETTLKTNPDRYFVVQWARG